MRPAPPCLLLPQIYMPKVIGMICAGLMLENIPWNAISACPKAWGSQMRAGALATIFLRCGLELDFGVGSPERGGSAGTGWPARVVWSGRGGLGGGLARVG